MQEFLKRLAEHFNKHGSIPAHIAEEYLNFDGTIDNKYLGYITKNFKTVNVLNNLVYDMLGQSKFDKNQKPNEVTEEEFNAEYVFGYFPNTREWITHFHDKYGKLLTRKALFKYLGQE